MQKCSLGSTQKLNLQKADWDSYKLLFEDRLCYGKIGKSLKSIENFSSTLLGVANEAIPKHQSKPIKGLRPCSMIHVKWRWLNGKNLYMHSPITPST